MDVVHCKDSMKKNFFSDMVKLFTGKKNKKDSSISLSESKEKLENHFYCVYRDNDTYKQIMPLIQQMLENAGNKVDIQAFPV